VWLPLSAECRCRNLREIPLSNVNHELDLEAPVKIISYSASTGPKISSPSSFDYVVLCAALLVAYDSSGQQKYHSVRLQQLVL